MKIELTREAVAEVIDYDPESGVFRWKVGRGRTNAGDVAGTTGNSKGYRVIGVMGRYYAAHRLAFLIMTGNWPSQHVDHINGQRDDNRFSNLREVSNSWNAQNIKKARKDSTTGLLGVVPVKGGMFEARIMVNGRIRHLGRFSTPEVAHSVYLSHKRSAHPGYVP